MLLNIDFFFDGKMAYLTVLLYKIEAFFILGSPKILLIMIQSFSNWFNPCANKSIFVLAAVKLCG